MKEYIVHAPPNNKLAVEEFTTFYGEPMTELIRCKDCVKAQICIMYRSDKDPYGFCKWAVRKEK